MPPFLFYASNGVAAYTLGSRMLIVVIWLHPTAQGIPAPPQSLQDTMQTHPDAIYRTFIHQIRRDDFEWAEEKDMGQSLEILGLSWAKNFLKMGGDYRHN